MQSMMGDEGKMSGLIATNHDQLEVLKHKGDRTYVEFTLTKGAKPTLLSPSAETREGGHQARALQPRRQLR